MEWYLVVPVGVGVLSTWMVGLYRWTMWILLVLLIGCSVLVYWIYSHYPPLDPIHAYNWVLSYCAPAILFAMLCRLVLDVL
jgi:hypothetical protein